MEISSVLIPNGIACALLVVLQICRLFMAKRHSDSEKALSAMVYFVLATCIVETLVCYIEGKTFSGAYTILLLGRTYLYLENIAIAVLWTIMVSQKLYNNINKIKNVVFKILIPECIMALLFIVNLFCPIAFSIDEDNHFHRGIVCYLAYIIAMVYMIISVVFKLYYQKKYGKVKFFPIAMFIVPPTIGALLQLKFYGVALVCVSTAIGIVGIYMSMQSEISYVDSLTGLYNRGYMDNLLRTIKSRHNSHASGIMIDIDDFKKINDTFGHSAGDNALLDVSHIICSAVPEKAYVMRYAGDKFVVVAPDSDIHEVSMIAGNIQNALRDFNSNNKRNYELSLSIGSAEMTDEQSLDDFFNTMDKDMYSDKNREYHNSTVVNNY